MLVCCLFALNQAERLSFPDNFFNVHMHIYKIYDDSKRITDTNFNFIQQVN